MNETRKGDILILTSDIIWSLFPIVTFLGVKNIPSMLALFWAILFSLLFFLLFISIKKTWWELKNLQIWKYALGTAFFNGVIFYGLYFYGLTKTLPANAAIISAFEVVASYVFFQIIKKESISKKHKWGIILATLGATCIFIPKLGGFFVGDVFIFLAIIFTPIGNSYMQKGRKISSSEVFMFARSVITILFLFVLTSILGISPLSYNIGNSIWWFLLNGFVILGFSKILWVEGIHRISVTKALALGSICPFSTIIFSWIIIGQPPTLTQLISLPLLISGIFILIDVKFRFSNKNKAISYEG
jgi:drug/metabolite transporter (DMT)-like permease